MHSVAMVPRNTDVMLRFACGCDVVAMMYVVLLACHVVWVRTACDVYLTSSVSVGVLFAAFAQS